MAPAPRRLTEVNQLSHCRYRFSRWVHIAAHPRSARTRSSYSAIAGGGLWPRDPVALMQVAIARLYPRPTEIARDGARSRNPVGPRAARQRAALVHAPRARAALRLRAAALQGAAAAARREGRVRVVGRGGRPRAVSGDLGRSRGVGRACAAEPRESASRGLPGPAWPRAARALGGVAAAASKRWRRICWTRCVWRCRVRAPLSSGGCSARRAATPAPRSWRARRRASE